MGKRSAKEGKAKSSAKAEAKVPEFHRDMLVIDALEAHSGVAEVLSARGLPCHRCIVSLSETLAEGCRALGRDVDAIVEEMRALTTTPADQRSEGAATGDKDEPS